MEMKYQGHSNLPAVTEILPKLCKILGQAKTNINKCFDRVELQTMENWLINRRYTAINLKSVKGRNEKELEIFLGMILLTQLHVKWN